MKKHTYTLALGASILGLASGALADVDKVIAVPWQGDVTKFHSTLEVPNANAGPAVPDSITFELLHTCASGTWEFHLNGASLGTFAVTPPGCTCAAPILSFTVDDTAGLLTASWDVTPGASNILRAHYTGGSTAYAWARAQITTAGATKTLCIDDYNGGDCTETNLCTAQYSFQTIIDVSGDALDAAGSSDAQHRLKGVIKTTDTSSVWYRWVFGDGTESAVHELSGATKYNVEIKHGYAGAIGTPFTAQLCVDGVDPSMANAVCDNYLVQIVPDNLDAQVNIAIDEGLWYLYKNQLVSGSLNSLNGDPVTAWVGYSNFYPCATAAVVQSFEINNHKETGDPDEDPYAEAVEHGLNWLLNGQWGASLVMNTINIGPQTHGDPDTNGNGIGIQVAWPGDPPYQGGMIMDCLIASQTPGADSGRDFDGDGDTDTYQEIVQDMADAYAWGQSDGSSANTRGGWDYGWNRSSTDNSTNQWAAIGLVPAADNFGAVIPQFVKDRNALSLQDTYNAGGRYWGYRNSTGLVNGTPGVTRPSGLVQMVLSIPNYQTDSRWIDVEAWYAANFSAAISPGERTYYGWLSFVKAMRLSTTETLSNGLDWYRGSDPNAIDGLAERLVDEQESDGSWVHNGQRTHPGQYGEGMAAGWAIQMLRPALFASPPIACFDATPNPTYPDFPIVFDPICSDHSDTEKDIDNIVLYEWDWDNDGTYDASTASPVPVVQSFPCASVPCTYPVTLRVTDDSDPALTATFTFDIQITNPPHPPTAVAGGPYIVSQCANDSLTLDGSASFDLNEGLREAGCGACPFDTITAWDWDVTPPLTDFTDFAADVYVLNSAEVAATFPLGASNIGLRVTDNTMAAYPGSGEMDLMHADFTTVEVFPACSDCEFTAEGCEEITLTSTLVGYEVLRSSSGPNHGFTSVGQAAGSIFVDVTAQLDTTYYYRLTDGACMTTAVQVVVPAICNQPPIAHAGGPYDAECAGLTTIVQLDGTASDDPDLPDDTLTYSWTATGGATFDDATSPTPMLTVDSSSCSAALTVTLSVCDEAGEIDQATVPVNVLDTTAPVLTLNGESEITLECHVDGYAELGVSIEEVCDTTLVATIGGDTVDTFTPGTYVVTYDATDACGNSAAQVTRTIEVTDTIAPAVTASVTTGTLWAPNHKLHTVGFGQESTDLCAAQGNLTTVIEVYSDESEVPETGDGTGRHAPDAKDITSDLRLRAERRGPEDGRVYLVVVRTVDESGNAGFGFTTVVVPHDQNAASEASVLTQAANAVAAAEAVATASTSATIADVVAALPGTWYQHGVSQELGPHQ